MGNELTLREMVKDVDSFDFDSFCVGVRMIFNFLWHGSKLPKLDVAISYDLILSSIEVVDDGGVLLVRALCWVILF